MASWGQNPTRCELCTYAYHFLGFRCWGIQIWDSLFNMFGLKSLDILLDLQTVTSRGQNQKYSFSLLMYIKLQVFYGHFNAILFSKFVIWINLASFLTSKLWPPEVKIQLNVKYTHMNIIGFKCRGIQIWGPLSNTFSLRSLDILLDLQIVTSRGQNQKCSSSLHILSNQRFFEMGISKMKSFYQKKLSKATWPLFWPLNYDL